MRNRDIAIGLVRDELNSQDRNWGTQRELNKFAWHAILSEEVGEVANAKLEHESDDRVISELIQVAAVALQNVQAILDNQE